jgi:hypothetical protein
LPETAAVFASLDDDEELTTLSGRALRSFVRGIGSDLATMPAFDFARTFISPHLARELAKHDFPPSSTGSNRLAAVFDTLATRCCGWRHCEPQAIVAVPSRSRSSSRISRSYRGPVRFGGHSQPGRPRASERRFARMLHAIFKSRQAAWHLALILSGDFRKTYCSI